MRGVACRRGIHFTCTRAGVAVMPDAAGRCAARPCGTPDGKNTTRERAYFRTRSSEARAPMTRWRRLDPPYRSCGPARQRQSAPLLPSQQRETGRAARRTRLGVSAARPLAHQPGKFELASSNRKLPPRAGLHLIPLLYTVGVDAHNALAAREPRSAVRGGGGCGARLRPGGRAKGALRRTRSCVPPVSRAVAITDARGDVRARLHTGPDAGGRACGALVGGLGPTLAPPGGACGGWARACVRRKPPAAGR